MPPNKQSKGGSASKKNPKKRPATTQDTSSKRRKTAAEKRKAGFKTHIDIPNADDSADDDVSMDEGDVNLRDADGAAGFLKHLDPKAISLSKREVKQRHKAEQAKLPKRQKVNDDLPSVEDHGGDDEYWSSTLESLSGEDEELDGDDDAWSSDGSSDDEQGYERKPRPRPDAWEHDNTKGAARLPIKMADGTVKSTGNLPARLDESESSDEDSDTQREPEEWTPPPQDRETFATGARFGRPAVVDVLSGASRKLKVQRAKEELATICQDIVQDPENSLGLLKRLQTFTQANITSPSHPDPVPNDPVIRKLALVSQLAVFKDIAPGYRIRVATEIERATKVSQIVLRQREFEEGLLVAYQAFLKMLEYQLKAKTELAEVALQCMCTLLRDLTHFNYRVNIMNSVVAYLSKKGWNDNSDMCLDSIIYVFRNDLSGSASLEIVRLLNRMIKERKYRVNPNVLSCLLHLRLKTELQGVRASEKHSSKDEKPKPKQKLSKKDKKAARPHLSKKARQTRKELKEIEEEMAEAEAEVDAEDRAKQQTETLKLLFVLYFSIIKNPRPTRLLSGALEGISRYAHLVNIDFFRDLLGVLKTLVLRHEAENRMTEQEVEDGDPEDREENELPKDPVLRDRELLRRRLLCISTAFELLSGQGEAITIDLGDFINFLYGIILELATSPDIEDIPPSKGRSFTPNTTDPTAVVKAPSKIQRKSIADLLFRTLYLVFHPRVSTHNTPPWRTAAFAKRILVASLAWPPATVMRSLEFVAILMGKEPRLEAMLSTDDRTADGVYKGELDDPQLCNAFASSFWELRMLERTHCDERVRKEAARLANYSRA